MATKSVSTRERKSVRTTKRAIRRVKKKKARRRHRQIKLDQSPEAVEAARAAKERWPNVLWGVLERKGRLAVFGNETDHTRASFRADGVGRLLARHGITVTGAGTTAGKKGSKHSKDGCSWALTTDCRNQELLEDVLFEDSVHMCDLRDRDPEEDEADEYDENLFNEDEIEPLEQFVFDEVPNMASAYGRWLDDHTVGTCYSNAYFTLDRIVAFRSGDVSKGSPDAIRKLCKEIGPRRKVFLVHGFLDVGVGRIHRAWLEAGPLHIDCGTSEWELRVESRAEMNERYKINPAECHRYTPKQARQRHKESKHPGPWS